MKTPLLTTHFCVSQITQRKMGNVAAALGNAENEEYLYYQDGINGATVAEEREFFLTTYAKA